MTNDPHDICWKCGCRRETHPIPECKQFHDAPQGAKNMFECNAVWRNPAVSVAALSDKAEMWLVTEPDGTKQTWYCYEQTPGTWVCNLIEEKPHDK